jgi:hypothetical protein
MLTGTVPTEFGMLGEINNFQVYENFLEGIIPTELGLLSSLKIFDLSDNCMSFLDAPNVLSFCLYFFLPHFCLCV